MQIRVALAFLRVVGLLLPHPMRVAAPTFLRQGAEPENPDLNADISRE